MRRLGKAMWLALACLACGGAATGIAVAEAKNASAPGQETTRIYLRARHEFEEALARKEAGRTDAGRALAAEIQRNCYKVLAGAQEARPTQALKEEAVADLEYVRRRTSRSAYVRFADTGERLSWPSVALTTEVHQQARSTKAMIAIPQLNICEEARALVASHYQTVPPATRRLFAEERAPEAPLDKSTPSAKTIDELLVPYEVPSDRAYVVPLLPPTRADEESFVHGLSEVLAALGLEER